MRCQCGTLTCLLDSLQHWLRLGGFFDWLCERHDAQIRGVR